MTTAGKADAVGARPGTVDAAGARLDEAEGAAVAPAGYPHS
jgi:hypothetical protein